MTPRLPALSPLAVVARHRHLRTHALRCLGAAVFPPHTQRLAQRVPDLELPADAMQPPMRERRTTLHMYPRRVA